MKFIFKSDYFKYIHPSEPVKETKEYTNTQLDDAIKNTNKIHYSKQLFDVAKENENVPNNQFGSILFFPEVDESNRKVMKSFIKTTFEKTIKKLKDEYSDSSDPVDIWEISDNGSHFDGEFENDKTGEKFNSKSISIYFAGCKEYTADYIIEEGIDNCFSLSSKRDKKEKDETQKINFGKHKSFLIYNLSSKKFYQIGTHNSKVYHKPVRNNGGYYSDLYSVDLPEAVNPLMEGFDFE